jgi:Cu(I)/Ag(I) efflux system membrane fusion protein
MNQPDNAPKQDPGPTREPETRPPSQSTAAQARKESLRWWLKLFIQPVLLLTAGALIIVGLGAVQRLGWISAGGDSGFRPATTEATDVRYICPMMCTPPSAEPGRCPVCAMELVPAASSGGDVDSRSIQIDTAARRVAGIRTVPVQAASLTRQVQAIGELGYDEGSLKTIAAYVDGRIERLYADYTGVVVTQGDHLALVYSPQLYSGQVELLLAAEARERSRSATLPNVLQSRSSLYDSAKERLVELGMTEQQVSDLEQAGKADSRLHLLSPISGTVIEKRAVEGQYVKVGQPIYRLADLSTLWLVLELFPEGAAAVRYGLKVEAEVQSLPGRKFSGRVAFIDPMVSRSTRTVGIRVVIPNESNVLRVGDYAKATIEVPLAASGDAVAGVYDPELADKWISPRHPHVIESAPGKCRVCGVPLAPASQFGFTDQPVQQSEVLVVPRAAVLMAGGNSVLYVETEPGRFEIRRIVLGPNLGDQIAILDGVDEGEHVALSGNFLIDSQMQLAGNPSLIDPTKATGASETDHDEERSKRLAAALAELSAQDQALAEKQQICPVTKEPLGSMGVPPKVDVNGRAVFLCCAGCESRLREDPNKYLANLTAAEGDGASAKETEEDLPEMGLPQMAAPEISDLPTKGGPTDSEEAAAIAEALARLPRVDRELAESQKVCPVADMPLGSMGTPIRVDVNGRAVFICCEGCRESLLAEPAKYLARLPEEVTR